MKKIFLTACIALLAATAFTGRINERMNIRASAQTIASTTTSAQTIAGIKKEEKTGDKEGSLKEITKPYLGVYRSEYIFFGKRDVSEEFKNLTVELTAKGQFILRYTTRAGFSDEKISFYTYDEKTGELSLASDFALREPKALKCKITVKKGKMTVLVRYGNRNLLVKLVHE